VARQREILSGRRDRFAVKVAFLPDPNEGRGATPEQSLSWGALEIWVNGYNLCGHVEMGEPVEAVHWYLLPFLQWLASNWDFLLHEERLPGRNIASDAWLSMLKTAEPPTGLPDAKAEAWEVAWQDWWQRHSLLACRDGGLFPALYTRRLQDSIEFSWGDRPAAGAPEHFRFNAHHGLARLRPDDVAWVLFDILDNASRHLHEEMTDSPVLQRLLEDVKGLGVSDHRKRLGLLSGVSAGDGNAVAFWDRITSLFPALPEGAEQAIFGTDESALVVTGACQAALMFGSLSPTIDERDARLLAAKLVEYYAPDAKTATLKNLVHDEPIERSDEEAWDYGYRLADDLLDQLGGRFFSDGRVDVDAVYSHLSISVDEIELRDRSIRAVAVAGPSHKPVALINRSYEFRDSEPRRFTLAHELCHLLYDRGYGARLAMASGPWAPVDIEKRANAFAAMFLMPTELVGETVRSLTLPLDSPQGVWQVANRLQTSFTSTVDHLFNLGYLDESTRDSIRAAILARAAATEK